MFFKRVLFTWRNRVLTLSQILLPLVFTAITIAIIKSLPSSNTAAKMPLNIEMYGDTKVCVL